MTEALIELGWFLTKWITVPIVIIAVILYIVLKVKVKKQKQRAIKRVIEKGKYYKSIRKG